MNMRCLLFSHIAFFSFGVQNKVITHRSIKIDGIIKWIKNCINGSLLREFLF